MKTNKFFLSAAIVLGLGLTACSSDDDISSGRIEKANTNVTVTLKLSASSLTKALPDDYNKIGEWAGKDLINKVAVYIIDGSSVTSKSLEVGSGKDYEITTSGNDITLVPKTSNAAIKTTAGDKKVYVLVNGTTEVVADLAKTPVAEFENAYTQAALYLSNSGAGTFTNTSADKLAVKNGVTSETIVMTNVEPKTITVAANVTEAQTLAATPQNRVRLQVERAVARVMVTTEKDTYTVPSTISGVSALGTISDINWVLAQGESSLFIQRKADWSTPNYGWVPTTDAAYWGTEITGSTSKYDYSGLFENYNTATQFGGTPVATMADYATGTVGKVTDELNTKLSGKFILPNTHASGTGAASSYKKGNTAYVLIRAKFTPSAAAFADGATYTAGNDFYVGANGKFYTSAENAVDATKGGVVGQSVAKYVNGKVLYYAWVNPDNVPTWYNSPVLRNNIYHIHITGFKNLGTNWNRLFPEDPAHPKGPEDSAHPGTKLPLNPDPKPIVPGFTEPVNPIDPSDPLTTPETWMSVDVKVLPWTLHSYAVDLGI
ncbi:Major fimbrial subunit protein type IV, Fimbrillin, C-terminal [Bacteroides luti]|uniref:Major fimbrial subunit protein type IV, Fimbrillin, C-terminal n=1 Tax=Bacteroides luti TaxID=1297750 RepID=A0A1M4U6I6_9BACE|nr:Mfa1 family fimbria major subunit [Bacteroides luti]SHE52253.1 Major fimbrial subunit protein type IV, Fimbrillin, C-terminal [Bacteroides luti]